MRHYECHPKERLIMMIVSLPAANLPELYDLLEELLLSPELLTLYTANLSTLEMSSEIESDEVFEVDEAQRIAILRYGLRGIDSVVLRRLATSAQALSDLQSDVFMVDDPGSYWYPKLFAADGGELASTDSAESVTPTLVAWPGESAVTTHTIPTVGPIVGVGGVTLAHSYVTGHGIVELKAVTRERIRTDWGCPSLWVSCCSSPWDRGDGTEHVRWACLDTTEDPGDRDPPFGFVVWSCDEEVEALLSEETLLTDLEDIVLYERFVRFKSLHQIARERGLNHFRVRRICHEARSRSNAAMTITRSTPRTTAAAGRSRLRLIGILNFFRVQSMVGSRETERSKNNSSRFNSSICLI